MRHVDFDGTGRLSHTRQALTDLDVRVLLRPDDITPSSNQPIVGEYLTTGNKRGWLLQLNTDSTLTLFTSPNGTTVVTTNATAPASAVYDSGEKFWIRATMDVNNGASGRTTNFYYSDDGAAWTQLGSTVTASGTTSIFSDAANVITLGGQGTTAAYTGKVYEVGLYSTIGGSANLVDPEPWDWSTATYGASGVTFVTPSVSATVQDVYPPRVLVVGTDLEADDSVTYFRVVAGERTVVRAAEDVVPGDTALVRTDAELPFGRQLSYAMVLNDDEEYSTDAFTVELPGGKVALSDAISGAAAEVVIMSWPEKRYERPRTQFVVGGRNVVVKGLMPGFTGQVEVYTQAEASADNVRELLAEATEGVIQLRHAGDHPTKGSYGQVDAYLDVSAFTEVRWSQDGTDAKRRFVLDVVEVEPWAANVEAAGFTYADLEAAYEGLTYSDLAGDFATYLDLALGDFS